MEVTVLEMIQGCVSEHKKFPVCSFRKHFFNTYDMSDIGIDTKNIKTKSVI